MTEVYRQKSTPLKMGLYMFHRGSYNIHNLFLPVQFQYLVPYYKIASSDYDTRGATIVLMTSVIHLHLATLSWKMSSASYGCYLKPLFKRSFEFNSIKYSEGMTVCICFYSFQCTYKSCKLI